MIKSNPSEHQYLSYQRNQPSTTDITRLQSLEKKQESLWQTIRENVSDAKKQFKKLNEQLKQELNNKLRTKAEVVEEILRTLDSKIQFVIESCQKYGNRIMQHINNKNTSDDTGNIQVYNQKFQLITEKMRVLEQRLFGFKQNQEELKSRLEILKDKNNQLSEEYRILNIRSNERISQLEHQIREKDHHLKQKTEELRKKQNNQAIKFTFVHPSSTTNQQTPLVQPQTQPSQSQPQHQPQQQHTTQPLSQPQSQVSHKPKSQQNSGIAHYNPQNVQQPHNLQQPKKQNAPKQIPHHNPIQYQPKHIQAQPFADNNSIEIRPDFFRNNGDSAGNKGIGLRSIREQNLMSARKPFKQNQSQMSQSQYHHRGGNNRDVSGRSQQHDHRFDYLMSNLVGTQADSSNPHFTQDSRISSRMSGYQSSYMHR